MDDVQVYWDIKICMKAKIADENKASKIGYERVKQKIKGVRQDLKISSNT